MNKATDFGEFEHCWKHLITKVHKKGVSVLGYFDAEMLLIVPLSSCS